jgi:hypothetical protein
VLLGALVSVKLKEPLAAGIGGLLGVSVVQFTGGFKLVVRCTS